MARDMAIISDSPFDQAALIEHLHQRYPQTWTFAVAGLIGATPEMLVSLHQGKLHSRVLAGSSNPEDAGSLPLSLRIVPNISLQSSPSWPHFFLSRSMFKRPHVQMY